MSVTLELPDDIGQRLLEHPEQAEPDVRRELAIALYREGKLAPGQAARLAGLERWDFERLLTARQIEFPMTAQVAAEDVLNALRRR
jgi:predicted HTH domain antitoxin